MSSGLITCMMFATNKLLLGTNSGVVTMLKVTRSNTYLLAKLNVATTFRNGKATDACRALAECEESDCNVEEQACIISSMHVVNRVSPSLLLEEGFDCLDDAESLLRSILLPAPVLVVCCNMGIAMYDCRTQDCLACLMLSDIFEEKLSSRAFVPLVDFVVAGGKDICDIYCISKMLIGGVEVCMAVLSAETNDLDLPDKFISMIPGEPLNLKSPLRCRAMRYKQPSVYGPTSGSSDCKSVRKQKSSGYGRPTRMQMFCPITNTHKKNCRNSTQVRRSLLDTVDGCSRQLLQQRGPPLTPVNKVSVWSSSCTATHLAVSGDGKHIACSSNRSDISVLNLAKLDTTSVNLLGHDKSINSLHFSLNSKWMVSSSTDGTAKVWDWTHRRCVLNVDNTVGSKYKRNGAKDKDSLDTVKQARFLFMDQFLLIAERGHLQLISHLLCEEPLSTGRSQHLVDWKRVLRIKMQTQHVTCFTAANHFHSYLVVCGCSSKAIKVYDLNAESLCLDIAEAHQRPPHCVVQLEGSAHSSLPAAMFDLILSAAVCDGVRLWDLRSARCVQKYSQHTNRCYGSGVDVSPCGRYIAASSDDKAVYVYDIRNSYKPLGKLLGLGDVVMDVAFSPCAPLLAAIALNARRVTFCP